MNFQDLEFAADPYPLYAEWRSEKPIWWAEDVQGWVLSRYEDVRAVLKDPAGFSSEVASGRTENTMSLPLLHDDPPRHTSLRAIVNRSFTSRVMREIEPDLELVVEQLLDDIDAGQPVDIAEALTIPLPVALIARFMGIPFERKDDFKRWSDSLTATGTAKTMAERMPDILEMMEFFRDEIPKRRAKPGDDLISKVVAAEVEGEMLTEETVVGYCQLLLIAGNETTTNLLSNLLHYIADHPGLWETLRADTSKIEAAIEETLRFDPPVHWISRVALQDAEFHGQQVAKGEAVFTVLGAANRDPEHYDDPDIFRLDRPRSDHHTFGHGIHFCIGAPLARMEARHALQGMLKRFAGVGHVMDAVNERTHSSMLRGYHHLWLRLESK
ncbi:MAG: cytochrome P450 [Pseudomonadales bacterium]|nr:cytochrome P450 [Pseudomonadales bacterium]